MPCHLPINTSHYIYLHTCVGKRSCVYLTVAGQGSGFNVAGRVESGHVQIGENVIILPAQEMASIKCNLCT